MKKEDIKNKYYDEFEISTKSREKITKGVIEDLKNIPTTSIANMDDWRTEKVKKENKHLYVVKKIGIASVSLLVTGAIILGVSTYKERNKHIKNAKNTAVEEISTENNYNKNDNYKKLFEIDFGQIIEKSSLKTALVQVKYRDYIYEIEGADMDKREAEQQTCMWLSIKGKNDDKFKEIKDFKFENKNDVYSNGKYVIAIYNNYVNKYDIEKDKIESVRFDKIKELMYINNKEYGEYTKISEVLTVKRNIVYLLVRREREDTNDGCIVDYDVISYDIKSGEYTFQIENYMDSYIINDNYMVVYGKYGNGKRVIDLYSFQPDGVVRERNISVKAKYLTGFNNLIYYIKSRSFGKKDEDYEVLKKFELYSYDVINDKETELIEVDIEDFGKDADYIRFIDNITNDDCEISVINKNHEVVSYKYIYATKNIKKKVE